MQYDGFFNDNMNVYVHIKYLFLTDDLDLLFIRFSHSFFSTMNKTYSQTLGVGSYQSNIKVRVKDCNNFVRISMPAYAYIFW